MTLALGLKLLMAHLLGDFVFQPDRWVQAKKEKKGRSVFLYLHLAIHIVLLLFFLQFDLTYWKGIVLIVSTHYLIDLTKLKLQGRLNDLLLLFLDQTSHLLILIGVVKSYAPFDLSLQWFYDLNTLLLLIAVILVSYVSSIIMRMFMCRWQFAENDENDSLKNAGKYIGILERLFVFCFIVLNQWQAIGLLITAKSVFRFSDLSRAKDRKLTEYILVGTLLSFGLAILTGLMYQYVAKRITV